jgi:VWFA-related protein
MRKLLAWASTLCVIAVAAGHAAQEAARSGQVFKGGVDLITVDVAALDSKGQPVEDLGVRDFRVKIDGKDRDVVSAELVRVDRDAPEPAPPASTTSLITTNAPATGGRLVAIGVDQTLIVPGSIHTLLGAASRFVDGLAPRDHVALVTFPEPGPRVDFTTDRTRLRDALTLVVGQPATMRSRTFYTGLTESIAINDKERLFVNLNGTAEQIWRSLGPMMRRVLERGTCEGLNDRELQLIENTDTLKRCVTQLQSEAMIDAAELRQEANLSLRRLESFLTELVPVEGPKSMVLVSAGLMVEDLSILNEVTRLAAAARTSIHVIAVEPDRDPTETIAPLPTGQSSYAMQDRQLELTGLETVADRTGGSFVRAIAGTGDVLFDRLSTELSAWYVVAVERRPGDPDRQRVDVEVRRRGVRVRAHRTVVATAAVNAGRPPEDVLREALSSPIAVSGVPLRVTTFTQRDALTGKYRLHVAAQVGQPGTPPGEFAVGYAVMDGTNRVVTSLGRRLTLIPAADANAPLVFDSALAIDPGSYSLRFGVVDREGRRGMTVHRVELAPPDEGELAMSDLIVGNVPPEGEALHPGVEPYISGRVAGYLELYPGAGDPGGLSVRFEIAEGAASPPLATGMLNIGAGAKAEWRVASGAIGASLLPGRYVARATILRGDETLRVVSRPFVLERGEDTISRQTERVRGIAISPALQLRTASYVARVVGSLGNVVATEEFTLEDPDRRVTSDFLLVRYPGSVRDLLSFRDVTHLNGAAVPGREEQLVALFVKPISIIRDRVRQITLAAEAHVPPVLNPIFGLAFLQPDFQSRFELTVSDAGGDWPRQVKAVEFVEIARPTLLRAGPLGDLDLPTRGTAWIEEATGRILQTEVQVGSGRNATTIVTRFRVDDRLQIMVPELMRTRNPAGVATYGNFRRFNVQTDTRIPDPSAPR